MKTILVVGSMNMDYTIYADRFPSPGETIAAKGREIRPGGKGANQAAACAKSEGVKILFFGARGKDNDGEAVEKALKSCGVICHTEVVSEETGNATILVNADGENEILIVEGANGCVDSVPEELIEECDYVILQNEIPASTNLSVIQKAKELGKPIIYNPAPAKKIEETCIRFSDYFIVNETELAFYGETIDVDEAIDVLLAKGAKRIIVTLGDKGSLYADQETRFTQRAYKVKALDTVGAGDTYVGYFASGVAQGMSVKEAMDYASKASAIAVTKKGSIDAIPSAQEVKLF